MIRLQYARQKGIKFGFKGFSLKNDEEEDDGKVYTDTRTHESQKLQLVDYDSNIQNPT